MAKKFSFSLRTKIAFLIVSMFVIWIFGDAGIKIIRYSGKETDILRGIFSLPECIGLFLACVAIVGTLTIINVFWIKDYINSRLNSSYGKAV